MKLTTWNKEVFGRVEERKNTALKMLAHWDEVETQRVLTARELMTGLEALEDFKRWVVMEELSCHQKSREIWLKEGNINTTFFTGWLTLKRVEVLSRN